MRAIMVLCLAWGFIICATPGFADWYVADPHPAAEQREAGNGHAAQARNLDASNVRFACRQADFNPGGRDRSGYDAEVGSVMAARYDSATDNPFSRAMPESQAVSQAEQISTGLCH